MMKKKNPKSSCKLQPRATRQHPTRGTCIHSDLTAWVKKTRSIWRGGRLGRRHRHCGLSLRTRKHRCVVGTWFVLELVVVEEERMVMLTRSGEELQARDFQGRKTSEKTMRKPTLEGSKIDDHGSEFLFQSWRAGPPPFELVFTRSS